eukprot:TRINITY_DN973_c0_g1_i1.p1 TRINITY_DN973_c0_g1~~TRINITY_DN973_c0_g1_i1.p1  ORF type:complete len:295 (+),score=112.34 TRINITY_DN973_c0_g1_i1:132-1016(+)
MMKDQQINNPFKDMSEEEEEGFGSPRLKESPEKTLSKSITKLEIKETNNNIYVNANNEQTNLIDKESHEGITLKPKLNNSMNNNEITLSVSPEGQKKTNLKHLSSQLKLAKQHSVENIKLLPETKAKSNPVQKIDLQEGSTEKDLSSPSNVKPTFKFGKHIDPQRSNTNKFENWGKNKGEKEKKVNNKEKDTNPNPKINYTRSQSFKVEPLDTEKEALNISSLNLNILEQKTSSKKKTGSLVLRSKHRTYIPQLSTKSSSPITSPNTSPNHLNNFNSRELRRQSFDRGGEDLII